MGRPDHKPRVGGDPRKDPGSLAVGLMLAAAVFVALVLALVLVLAGLI